MPEEFELTITAVEPPADDGTNVQVRYARGTRVGTFSLAAVTEAVTALQRLLQQHNPLHQALAQHGATLYRALFAGAVGDAFRDCLTLAQERQTTVRLRIYSELPAIIAIPWEYLYDEGNQRWLVLQPDISLVRGLPLNNREPQPVEELLRVLVMVSTPTDLAQLAGNYELANLFDATLTAAIEVIPMTPTYKALQDALRQKPHVFHFIGHGTFGANHEDEAHDAAQGSLAFCKADNTAEFVGADRLVPLLASCDSLGLVFLNACKGAVTGGQSAFAGFAQRLIQQQIPAVVAMQAPVVDDHAMRFSKEFYAALAAGDGIETAIGDGRRGILDNAHTWGIPTFYLQANEPFDIPQLTAAQKAERLWQKSRSAQVLGKRRQLLEAALAIDPDHADAQAGLVQLENEVEAASIYAAAHAYMENEEWRDAHRALEQVRRLLPNYRETRSLLSEVLGKLNADPPAVDDDPLAQVEQYRPMLNALLEGRLTLFLGGDVGSIGQPAADQWVQGHFPPRAADVARALADHLPTELQDEGSLLRISQYTVLLDGEYALYERLNSLYEGEYTTTILHRLLAEIPKRLADKGHPKQANARYVLFSTAYDDLLERAFAEAEQPFHLFAYRPRYIDDNGVTQPERFLHIPPLPEQAIAEGRAAMGATDPPWPEPIEVLEPNRYTGHDHDNHPIIVKLCGRRVTPNPDSVAVTEDQYINYGAVEKSAAVLPTTLLKQIRRNNVLFFGHSLESWHLRLLWQRLRLPGGQRQPKWAIVPKKDSIEEIFWDSQAIKSIVARPEGVVAYVNKWLETL